MFIGHGFPITKQIIGAQGAPAFDPLTLSPVAFYSPAGPFYSDAAGTIQVTTDGAMVRIWNDISGNNRHAIAASAGTRGTLRVSGGKTWVEFDGIDDNLISGSVFSFTAANPMAVAAAVRPDQTTGNRHPFGVGTFSGGGLRDIAQGSSLWQFSGFAADYVTAVASTVGSDFRHTIRLRTSGSSVRYVLNGSATTGSTTGTLNNITNQTSRIGVAPGDPTPTTLFAGRVYGGIIFNTDLSDADMTNVDSYLQSIMP